MSRKVGNGLLKVYRNWMRKATEICGCLNGSPQGDPFFVSALSQQLLHRADGLPGDGGHFLRRGLAAGILPGYDAAKAAVYRKGQQLLLALGTAAVGLQLP